MADRLASPAGSETRLTSIDMLRGLVMVIMALDHVRDMVTQPPPANPGATGDFSSAAGALFFTRWVTHICAPTFMLLAGIAVSLYGASGRRRNREISQFLIGRGTWLVVVELTVVNVAWAFHVPTMIVLQVIWAIGCSMIALAGLIWLPRTAIAAVSVIMIAAHNGLDGFQPSPAEASPLWLILHVQGLLPLGKSLVAFVVYPLIPWIGVMGLGYAIGPYFAGPNPLRPRRLLQVGLVLTLAFFLLRAPNLYGEPTTWIAHADTVATVVNFFNVTKYPPSLQYLLMTLGPALMLLGWFEGVRGRIAEMLVTIGRVPFFYYVVHLYLIHTLAVLLGLWQGFAVREIAVLFIDYPANFGVSLGGVYLLWVLVIVLLYPACAWFAGVKTRRREWWIRYL